MVDDTDPKLIWRGIGRGLDRCYPPDDEPSDSIERLLDALREREECARNRSSMA